MNLFIKMLWLILLSQWLVGCDGGNDSSTASVPTDSTTTTYTLSGKVSVANNTSYDIDVNDSEALYTKSNDTYATAQTIANPIILGGYVNQPNFGSAGRSKVRGDVNDFYIADLRKGQALNLYIAQATLGFNDLDLILLDSNGKAVDASVGETEVESLTVPSNGRFYIQVNAVSGASNYVLSIGQRLSSSQGLRLSSEFMPDQAIIQLKSQQFSAQSTLNSLSAFGMTTQSTDTSRAMLFHFDAAQLHSFSTPDIEFASSELKEKYDLLMKIKQLRARPDIEEASPNYILKAQRVPNDPQYNYQWNYSLLRLPQAWDMTTGSSDVVVAVIDTGVLLAHPDIQGKTVAGYDFISDTKISLDGDGIDNNPDDPGDQGEFNGNSTFHGTHVAGTIAASTDNNKGVAGVGWNTRVMPLRVLGKGGAGDDYSIEQAVRFAARLSNDSGTLPAKKADVINLSLGGAEVSTSFRRTITDAYNMGVVIVAAAGNEGTSVPMYPAALTEVISTGAVDINKEHPDYSNYGATLKVVAPGGARTADVNGDGMPDGIFSTVGTDEKGQNLQYSYGNMIGTSMASPHVAAVVALMKAVHPYLTPKEVNNLLINNKITEDLGTQGRDDFFGYGLLDAQKAVYEASLLSGGVTDVPQPQLVVNPSALNFGLTATTVTLTASNAGGGDLQLQRVYENSGGFLSITTDGTGEYTVTVNRKGLSAGTYSATITFQSNANTVNVPVIMQVGDTTASSANAGHYYILLVDAATKEALKQVSVNSSNGIYEFQFSGIARGNYLVVAGTDMNNDGQICDGGEACGAYLTSSDPTQITVPSSRSDLNFGSGFNVVFTSQALSDEFVATTPSTEGYKLLSHELRSIAE